MPSNRRHIADRSAQTRPPIAKPHVPGQGGKPRPQSDMNGRLGVDVAPLSQSPLSMPLKAITTQQTIKHTTSMFNIIIRHRASWHVEAWKNAKCCLAGFL